jgi:hypothetical protein
MDILKQYPQQGRTNLMRFSTGCFTVDRAGHIVTSTLPQSFPTLHLKHIAQKVIATFGAAQEAQLSLTELIINYPALKLSARELRGGAIVFLTPRSLTQTDL